MTNEEVLEVMGKRRSAALVPQYKIIYHMATGKPHRGCLCGNGFDNLYRACNAYAENIKKNNKETIIITE